MLILTRKLGEQIAIGENIRITMLEIKGSQAKLGIEAPRSIGIYRNEIYEKIVTENLMSSAVASPDVSLADALLRKTRSQ
jgi:carbon storage regulator